LIDAYQEDLMGLEELRDRMPALKKREESVKAELQAMAAALADDQLYLRVVNSLDSFHKVIQKSQSTMAVQEKQKVLRLLVKEILVFDGTVKIKHSIPVKKPRAEGQASSDGDPDPSCYLLRGRRPFPAPEQYRTG
jgi:site-specific DNA recombinase